MQPDRVVADLVIQDLASTLAAAEELAIGFKQLALVAIDRVSDLSADLRKVRQQLQNLRTELRAARPCTAPSAARTHPWQRHAS